MQRPASVTVGIIPLLLQSCVITFSPIRAQVIQAQRQCDYNSPYSPVVEDAQSILPPSPPSPQHPVIFFFQPSQDFGSLSSSCIQNITQLHIHRSLNTKTSAIKLTTLICFPSVWILQFPGNFKNKVDIYLYCKRSTCIYLGIDLEMTRKSSFLLKAF